MDESKRSNQTPNSTSQSIQWSSAPPCTLVVVGYLSFEQKEMPQPLSLVIQHQCQKYLCLSTAQTSQICESQKEPSFQLFKTPSVLNPTPLSQVLATRTYTHLEKEWCNPLGLFLFFSGYSQYRVLGSTRTKIEGAVYLHNCKLIFSQINECCCSSLQSNFLL